MRRSTLITLALTALLACESQVPDLPVLSGDPTSPQPDAEPDPVACDDPEALAPIALRRLTHTQLSHTLEELALLLMPESEHEWVRYHVQEIVADLPADIPRAPDHGPRGGFRRLDQDVVQEHADGWLTAATQLGAMVGGSWAISSFLDDCPIPETPTACLDAYLRDAGRLILRRPLTEDEVSTYLQLYQDALADLDPEIPSWEAAGIASRTVVSAVFAHPAVTFRLEHTGPDDGSSPGRPLDAWSLADRLAFHFWQGPPDAQLRALADDGTLVQPEVYEAEVRRVFADPKTTRAIADFFDGWLRLEDMPDPRGRFHTPRFMATFADLDLTTDLHEAMAEELQTLARIHTWAAPTSLSDLLRSDLHVTDHPTLASIYDEAPWDGIGTPPTLSQPERAGLLTRAGLLVSGEATTRPIHKGVLIREALLCAPVPPPPDNIAAVPPAPEAELSTREVVETLTEQPDSTCISCHAHYINPLGFVTEGFDALGRVREEETLRFEDGELAGMAPVETQATVQLPELGGVDLVDPHDLVDALDESGLVHDCFATRAAQWTFMTDTPDVAQTCASQELAERLRQGDPLDEALLQVALSPAFRRAAGGE